MTAIALLGRTSRPKEFQFFSSMAELANVTQCLNPTTRSQNTINTITKMQTINIPTPGVVTSKYYLFLMAPEDTRDQTKTQQTIIFHRLGQSAVHSILAEKCMSDSVGRAIGAQFRTLVRVSDGKVSFNILRKVTLNSYLCKYQLNATLLTSSYLPFRVKTSLARKRLFRYINFINGSLSFGSYFCDPERGTICFQMSPSLTKQEFERIFTNNNLLIQRANQDFQALRNSCINYMPKFLRVAALNFRPELDQNTKDTFNELLPMLNQSFQYNELDINDQRLCDKDRMGKIIRQSKQKLNADCSIMSNNHIKIVEATKTLNTFLGEPKLNQQSVQDIKKRREMLDRSQFRASNYNNLLTKSTAVGLWRIYNKIFLVKEPKDKDWQIYSTTENSELRRQKIIFSAMSTEPYQPLEKVNRFMSLKCPLKVSPQPENKACTQRQADFVRIFATSECSNIAKFYMPQGPQINLGKPRPIKYNECVLSDYYTYHSVDNYVALNCKTMSSLTMLCILSHMAMALRFLKNIHVIHCDVKWSNALFAKGCVVKLSDFGEALIPIPTPNSAVSKQLNSYQLDRTKHPGQTLPYSPPEVTEKTDKLLQSRRHRYDVYSYGVMLSQLLFGCYPILMRKGTDQKLMKAYRQRTYSELILENVERLYNYVAGDTAEILCYVVLRCMDPDPQKRPCIDWIQVIIRTLYVHVEKHCV